MDHQVPDIQVNVSMILDKLPKGDKKGGRTIFSAMFFFQIAFVLQNPDKHSDPLAQHRACVEGTLRVYEIPLKANPKDRQPYLDELIERREAGTLAQFVKKRTEDACKKVTSRLNRRRIYPLSAHSSLSFSD